MDHESFDALVQRLGQSRQRRAALKLLTGAPLALGLAAAAPLLDAPPAAAKKPRRVRSEHNVRRNKAVMCVNGATMRVPKKRRKGYLKQGATRGECAVTPTSTTTCTPVCPTGDTCGMADGCGGTCGCGANGFCRAGVCVACDVACTGNATACGDALRARLPQGGTIQLCPGTYAGPFSIAVEGTTVIGAGSGADPTVDSILDGQNTNRVLSVPMPATLKTLRITRGYAPGVGGGIIAPVHLHIEDCVVTGNTSGSVGGGIAAFQQLTVTRTDVTFNTSLDAGAGIYVLGNSTDNHVLADCNISDNTATADASRGGGVYIVTVFLTVTGTTIARNKAGQGGGLASVSFGSGEGASLDATSRVLNNQATNPTTPIASGILNQNGTVTVDPATTVTGNTPLPQCSGVSGC